MRAGMAAGLMAAMLLIGGCSAGTVTATSGQTAASAPAAGSSLSASDFAAAAKLPGTVLLDVRTPAEFAAGHITGAVNLDVESAAFPQQVATLDPAKNYAVYCRSGSRSKAAMTAMGQAGFGHLFDLAGGIGAWQSSGGQLVTG
ncbi:MAG: rhodanese-like domain-containing protein [Propionicimonas sp.]